MEAMSAPHQEILERARLRGSLRTMSLAELVRLFDAHQRTGIIHIHAPPGCGVIHVDEGQVSFARFNVDGEQAVTTGPAAFTRMLACEDGSFGVSFGACAFERNVYGSTPMLLRDAARILEEERR